MEDINKDEVNKTFVNIDDIKKQTAPIRIGRLGGCILLPREPISPISNDEDEDEADTDNDMEFENSRQKLAHYLLCGKKMYVRKTTGHVSAEFPENDVAIFIPPGKLSLIGSEENNKFDRFNDKHEVYSIDEVECIIFNDERIRNTINEIINESTSSQTNVSDAPQVDKQVLSDDDKVILSYSLICLRHAFNYNELKRVFEHIDDFEHRFPCIANCLFEHMDHDKLLLLKRQILKVKLIGSCNEKKDLYLSPSLSSHTESIQIPGSKGFIPNADESFSYTENLSEEDREKILKEKRELLKKKLLAGENIDLKSTSRPSESDQSIKIPRGGLV